jgi:ankyrin repeat protein
MTPLSAALNKCGWLIFNKHAVELLVQHGADVNAVDLAGNSCLAKACSDKEMTALLLDHGAVVTQDVFMQAIALNNADLLTLLLSRGANPNVCGKLRQPRQGGSTKIYHEEHYPLHRLLSKSKYRLKTASDHENHKRMIETLLDHGANPCAPYDGSTILHELIQDNEDISVLFMKPGIDLDLECRNVSGLTPLLMACLQTSSPDKTRSHNAENRSTIGMLIHHGVDIRARDCKGNNFLHLFTKNGGNRSDLLSIIQQAPRLINQPNNEGSTPLHIAMKSLFREERINLFLDNDGDIHTTDGKGDSMLHILMRCQWGVTGRCGEVTGTGLTLFNRLLAKGANINARNEAGETPIFSFMRDGRVSSNSKHVKFSDFLEHPVYELFTRCGVDWQVLNAEGQNLLHAVAAGPSVDHLFFDRISPDSNKRDRFAALLNFGLDAGLEDKAGRTPLDIAVEVGQKEILELFQKN